LQIEKAKQEAALYPQQLAEQKRAKESQYMQGVSREIAQSPENMQKIIEKHTALAPQLGINPEHISWLANDLSSAKDMNDLQGRAMYHANPQEYEKEAIKSRFAKTTADKAESLFAKVDPKDYTPESVMKFGQSKDYSVLVPRVKTEDPSVKLKRVQDIEMKLADDYRTESKGWAETSTSMKKALAAMDNAHKNPGSALAAGTAFMKILDPNSVVRETELGMALNASGWFDRAGNITEKLQSGVVMTPLQQKQLKAAATDLFEEAKKAQLEVDSAYKIRAKNYGADPKNIITQRGQELPDSRIKTPPAGWTLHTDANGNKAYVSPDGKQFQEAR